MASEDIKFDAPSARLKSFQGRYRLHTHGLQKLYYTSPSRNPGPRYSPCKIFGSNELSARANFLSFLKRERERERERDRRDRRDH